MAHAKQNPPLRRATAIAAAVLALALACVGAAAYAKYAHQATDDRSVAAHSFYFSSDFLTEDGAAYTLGADTTCLAIELRNYDDASRWSDDDVGYSYEVTRQGDGEGTDAGDSVASGSGTIIRSDNAASTSTIAVTNLTAGTYAVTATSTSPFAKTLAATFTIPEELEGVLYKVSDSAGSPTAQLTVSTRAYNGGITVSWPEGVFPDTTQAVFSGVSTYDEDAESYAAGSQNIGSLGKFGSATYRFFKVDPQKDYSSGGAAGGDAITATATATDNGN